MVITFSNIKGSAGGGGATGGTVSGITLWSDETTKAYIDDALSGVTDVLSAYTKTEDFATINGSAITSGGNLVIEETPYTAGTNIDITDHIISVTGISVPTKVSELVNDEGYITTADTQNLVTSGDVQTQINDSISGKADSSAVTAQINEVKAEIEAKIPSKVSDLQNDLNFVNYGDVESMISGFTTSADVKTQIESYNYINSGQAQTQIDNSISGKVDNSALTQYYTSAQTDTAISNAVSGKMDTSAISAYTKTEDFATINGSAITEGGNIVVEETPYSGGTNIEISNHVISVTGITVPTKLSELTNDEGFVNSGEVETQINNKDYPTKNWVQDQVSGKVDTDVFITYTASTQTELNSKQDISGMTAYYTSAQTDTAIQNATNGLASEEWVESQGYLKEHQDISGKLDSNVFTAYTANTKTEIDNKQDASAMTAYATTAFTESTYLKEHQSLSAYSTTEQVQTLINTAKQEVENEIPDVSDFVTSAQVNTQIESKGYLTAYTENDPVFMASPASCITSQDITNWNAKLDSSDLEPYYTSAQTDTAINNAVSGKADLSAVTAQIGEVKAEIEAKIPSKVSDLQNDLNFVNSGNVKTQVEGYNYINSGQAQTQIDNSISGKLDTDVFTAYTASTQTEIDNKQDISGMTEYATTAFTESTYLKEHQSLSAYTPTSGFSTINGSAITSGGNIVVEETPYSAGTNIDITDHVISVTGISVPTKLSELTNDEGFVNSGEVETQITSKGYITGYTETDPVFQASAASGITSKDITNWNAKLDSSDLEAYYTSAQTNNAISDAISGKADLSAVTAQISEVKQEIEAEIPTKVSELQNDLNFVNSGDVKTQVESYNYINSGQAQTQIDNSISGKLNTDAFTTYTANTQTELNNKQDISGMTEYATTAFTENTYAKIGDIPTKTSDLTNDSGFITDAALSGYATEQYVDNSVSGKVDNSALTQYYTSAQTDTAISNAVSGKLDTSAITAYSTTEEVENMITAATNGLASEEWVNNQGFLKEHQDISGKLDTSVFTAYTANTKTEIDNKQDASAMTAYATTAFTESTYLKEHQSLSAYSTTEQMNQAIGSATAATTGWVESQGFLTEHQSLSAYTPTSGFSTINGSAITSGDNIIVEETPYSGGTNIDIIDHVISVTGITVPTKLSELINDEGFVNSGEVETQITDKGYITGYTESDPVFQASAASGITSQDISNWNNKLDSSDLEAYYTSAETDTAISNAVSGKLDTSAMSAYTKTEGFATINGSAITEGGNIEIQGGSSIENYQPLQVEFDPSYSFIDAYEINSVGKQQFYKRIAFDTINGNSIIHQSDNDKVNWTIPTSTSALTNDSGYVTSGEVNTQIESKGYITDADLNGYATTAFTEQTYLKEHQSLSAYTPTSGFSTINGRSITEGGNIVIQGGGSGSDYIAGANIEITADNVINVTGITIPTKLSELTNDEGFVNSGEVETQITSKGYITAYTENDPVFMASPASGISEQDITNWNSKLDASSLDQYYTSAQTDTAINNATSGKQDTLVSGTNIKTINNESILGSGNIVIQGGSGGGSNIIELTQAEYDALTAYTEDAIYVITDSQAINMDNYVTTGALGSYYTSAETDTAISNAVSGKTDKISVTESSSGYKFPTWNNQGCITGTYSTAYQASQSINGSSITLYSTSSSSLPTIYAPTSAGSTGQPLLSNGSGAPVWASYKFQFISKSQYDALATKDSTTIYFIVNEN